MALEPEAMCCVATLPRMADDVTTPQAVEALLERRGMSALLRDFVADCARVQPENLAAHMATWAAARAAAEKRAAESNASTSCGPTPPMSLLGVGGRPAALSGDARATPPSSRNPTPRKCTARIAVVLGGNKSNKEQLVAALDVASLGVPMALTPTMADAVSVVRQRLADLGVDEGHVVLPVEADGHSEVVFVDVDSSDLTPSAVAAASLADVALLVVSARAGAADMALRRQGETYNRAMLAHALGIKRAVVVITETRGVSAADIDGTVADAMEMVSSCGYDRAAVPVVRLPAAAEDVAGIVSSLPLEANVKYRPETTTRFRANVMVLGGGSIRVGDKVSVFAGENIVATVSAIPSRTERGVSTRTSASALKLHQVGTLDLEVAGSHVAAVAVAAPAVVFTKDSVVAMGAVADIDELSSVDEGFTL